MIDRFSKNQFEDGMRSILNGVRFQSLGLVDGEECYAVPVNEFARVMVRSSVDRTGMAGDTGEDSIRVVLEVMTEKGEWRGSKKIGNWVTRVPGWAERMRDKMRTVYGWGKMVKKPRTYCTKCGKLKGMWLTKGGKRPGHLAEKCFSEREFNQAGFGWMDKPSAVERRNVPSTPDRATEIVEKLVEPTNDEAQQRSVAQSGVERESGVKKAFAGPQVKKKEQVTVKDRGGESEVPYTVEDKDFPPTEEQREFIELPVDANVRLLAGPGSGKTFAVGLRNVFLIKHGVDPKRILNVTFSNAMAASGVERVVKALKKAEESGEIDKIGAVDLEEFRKRFSTIHAACNRILKDEGLARRIAPKNWMVTKLLKEIAERHWPIPTDRPGPDELAVFIGAVKRMGLTSQEDMAFFGRVADKNGKLVGQQLHDARRDFDRKMEAKGWWTFADQCFDMEQKLKRDRVFREKWQGRFSHVLVDEGQDTNAQAMRILVTLSLEPGDNRIYHDWNPVEELGR